MHRMKNTSHSFWYSVTLYIVKLFHISEVYVSNSSNTNIIFCNQEWSDHLCFIKPREISMKRKVNKNEQLVYLGILSNPSGEHRSRHCHSDQTRIQWRSKLVNVNPWWNNLPNPSAKHPKSNSKKLQSCALLNSDINSGAIHIIGTFSTSKFQKFIT